MPQDSPGNRKRFTPKFDNSVGEIDTISCVQDSTSAGCPIFKLSGEFLRGRLTVSILGQQWALASKLSSISLLTSFASRSAITASLNCSTARSLSLIKTPPLTNSSVAPSALKSSSGASSNMSSHHASSRSVTTACSVPLSGNCYRKPDNCSPSPPANLNVQL
jgi:hypothetical protein